MLLPLGSLGALLVGQVLLNLSLPCQQAVVLAPVGFFTQGKLLSGPLCSCLSWEVAQYELEASL